MQRTLTTVRSVVQLMVLTTLGFLPAIDVVGQSVADQPTMEIVALVRGGLQSAAGVQVEYAATRHIVPWLSARYGWYGACAGFSECPSHLVSAMGGARFRTGAWGKLDPYVTLGLGQSWWRDSDRSEATGTANIGAAWLGFGRIRPRFEFGYEGHSAGAAVAVGLKLR